jgi:meiotically up-regulated gene 157 (Mug157) protein
MIWPMSLIMKAMTSSVDDEIRYCVKTLRDADGDTGFMHESFNRDDPRKFTRSWFAWANTLFGELILKLMNEGKTGLLNGL